jgi:VWA domain-containing protein/aerotolerance regulator-like protein
MSILFLNSILLPLLILGILPLLLHLFSRAKPPIYKFSSNEFLNLIIKRTKRIRKPQDIILLILRTLLFMVILLMFLQPLFFSNKKLAGLLVRKNIVILVDASSSMGYLEGGQTRFASACAEASEILRGLSSRDKANVIFIKSKPDNLFPSPGVNINYLREKLRNAKVSNEPGNVGPSVRKAIDMFEGLSEGIDEICIISDFQRSQWKDNLDLKIPEKIAVTLVKVGKTEGTNQVVSKVSCSPLLPLLGEEVTFHCEITNFSPAPRRLTMFFQAGELHESSSLLIPAWGSATPTFRMKKAIKNELSGKKTEKEGLPGFQNAGTFSYEFSIGEDDFAEDNRRWGLLKIAKSLKTAIVEFTPSPGIIWKRALKVFPWIDIKTERIGNISLDDKYDFLFLSGWDGTDAEKVRKFIENGVIVICAPAAGTEIEKLKMLTGNKISGEEGLLLSETAPQGKPYHLKISNENDKIFSIFANGEYGDPVSGYVKKRLKLPKKLFDTEENIISYHDGVPALLRYSNQGKGQFYIWNIPLNLKDSNFAGRVQFVPFLAELVLASRWEINDVGHLANYTPGESLIKIVDFVGSVKDIALKDPEGKDLSVKIEVDNAKPGDKGAKKIESVLSLVSSPVSATGIYSWNFSGEKIGNSVVNFAVSESDLRSISTSELSVHGTSTIAGSGAVNAIHEGIMLWPYLLALAIIFVICEGLVMFWAEKGT